MSSKYRRTAPTAENIKCTTGMVISNFIYSDTAEAAEKLSKNYELNKEELYECAIDILKDKLFNLARENAMLKSELERRKNRIVIY